MHTTRNLCEDNNCTMDLSEYRFTESHEWVHIKDGLAYVGISDHAQQEITDVVFVDLPDVGKQVKAGDELLLVDSVKASFSIYAPVGGQVARINEQLADQPDLINSSPYEAGWMVAVEASNLRELNELMTDSQYEQFLATQE